jgi:hypothetical protein
MSSAHELSAWAEFGTTTHRAKETPPKWQPGVAGTCTKRDASSPRRQLSTLGAKIGFDGAVHCRDEDSILRESVQDESGGEACI